MASTHNSAISIFFKYGVNHFLSQWYDILSTSVTSKYCHATWARLQNTIILVANYLDKGRCCAPDFFHNVDVSSYVLRSTFMWHMFFYLLCCFHSVILVKNANVICWALCFILTKPLAHNHNYCIQLWNENVYDTAMLWYKDDSGGKVNILGGIRITHCEEKVRMTRYTAVKLCKHGFCGRRISVHKILTIYIYIYCEIINIYFICMKPGSCGTNTLHGWEGCKWAACKAYHNSANMFLLNWCFVLALIDHIKLTYVP
jgi:hypothetical protein